MWQDVRNSIRTLARNPGFALTSIVTLAVAVGMATSIFTVVHALLLRPLPYRDASQLARIWSASKDDSRGVVSFDDFGDWLRNSKPSKVGLPSAPTIIQFFPNPEATPSASRASRSRMDIST